MRYSVIIPLFNKRNCIRDTLQSVLNQTYQDYEIIVVDDGSTDDSAELVREFTDRRIRLIQQDNNGVSNARNTGIKAAKGDFISFLDADDVWMRDYLETITKLIASYPKVGMFTTAYEMRYKKRIVTVNFKECLDSKGTGVVPNFFQAISGRYSIVISSNVTIRKSLLDKTTLFNEDAKTYEDFDLWFRLACFSGLAHSTKVCATYNRLTENNARERNKLIDPNVYLATLSKELNNPNRSHHEIRYIQRTYNRRYTAYIFSLIVNGMKVEAKKKLFVWKPMDKYIVYKAGLLIACHSPYSLVRLVQRLRHQLF